jgi:hypothetical protein
VERSTNTTNSTGVEILPITSSLVEWWWTFAEPFVKSALEHNFGEATADDIKEACKARRMQLWVVSRNRITIGAATTMLVKYDRKAVVRVVTLAGKDFQEWVGAAVEFIKGWALEAGADSVEVNGRHGFEKLLKGYGFRSSYVVMVWDKNQDHKP